jgi:hypothetical protein
MDSRHSWENAGTAPGKLPAAEVRPLLAYENFVSPPHDSGQMGFNQFSEHFTNLTLRW